MKTKIMLITMSAGVALLAATAVASPLYRCTGSDGRVVYSDRKCASGERREVVKIIDNSMDNSNLQNTVAIQGSSTSSGGGGVAVVGNNSRSASSSSASSSSPRPARRRCGR